MGGAGFGGSVFFAEVFMLLIEVRHNNYITGRAKGRLQGLPGEEVEEAFKDQN